MINLVDEATLANLPYMAKPCFQKFELNQELIGYCLNGKNNTIGSHYCIGLFAIVADVFDENEENYGRLIKYKTRLGKDDFMYLNVTDDDFYKKLRAKSFFIKNDPEVLSAFKKMLDSPFIQPEYFVPYFSRTMYSKKYHSFALPDGLYSKDGKKYIIYDNKNTLDTNGLNVAGSYDEWKSNLALELVKFPIPTFALLVSFAALLYPFVDVGTVIVHFYGTGSQGKTSLLQFAGSIFGRGSEPRADDDKSFLSSWSGTAVGLEAKVSIYNGTVGLFDELHLIDDKDFPKAIYSLCGGASKSRAKSNGTLQPDMKWRFPALSSGEESGFEKILKTNDPTLGQLVRFLDIPVTEQIFTEFDGRLVMTKSESEKLVSNLKKSCVTHYGHAGRDFMCQLLNLAESHEELKVLIEEKSKDIFQQLCTSGLKQEEIRVMRNFALFALAGYLAVDFGILPIEKENVLDAVIKVRDLWCANKHSNQTMAIEKYGIAKDYVLMLRQGIMQDIASYAYTTDLKPKSNCKGFLKLKQLGQEMNAYLLYPKTFEKIFSGHDLKKVCDVLCEKGFLIRDRDQYKKYHRISSLKGRDGNSARVAFYTIDSSILETVEENLSLDQCSDDELDMAMNFILNKRKSDNALQFNKAEHSLLEASV